MYGRSPGLPDYRQARPEGINQVETTGGGDPRTKGSNYMQRAVPEKKKVKEIVSTDVKGIVSTEVKE